MDIASFLQNKPLLVQLSREYEELVASGADVDYSSWVKQRLQQAAAELGHAGILKPQTQGRLASATAQNKQSLTFSRGASYPRRSIMGDPGQSLQLLHGSGPTSLGWQQPVITKTKLQIKRAAALYALHNGKENIPEGPSGVGSHDLGLNRAADSDPWRHRPSSYVGQSSNHAQDALGHPARKSSVPDWVHAATLQAALQSGTKPELKAAAERERLLAISSALAQQHLASGVAHPYNHHLSISLHPHDGGFGSGSASSSRAELAHMASMSDHVSRTHETLAAAVKSQAAQLKQQQVLLQRVLDQQSNTSGLPVSPEQPPAEAAKQADGSLDVWFVNRAIEDQRKQPQAPGGGPKVRLTAKETQRALRKETLKGMLREVLKGSSPATSPPRNQRPSQGSPSRPSSAVRQKSSQVPTITAGHLHRSSSVDFTSLENRVADAFEADMAAQRGKEWVQRMAGMEAQLSALVSKAEQQLHSTPSHHTPLSPHTDSTHHPFNTNIHNSLPPRASPSSPRNMPHQHADSSHQQDDSSQQPPAQLQGLSVEVSQRPLDVLQLKQMMTALHSMEENEAAVRRRWFTHAANASTGHQQPPAIGVVHDIMSNSLKPAGPSHSQAAASHHLLPSSPHSRPLAPLVAAAAAATAGALSQHSQHPQQSNSSQQQHDPHRHHHHQQQNQHQQQQRQKQVLSDNVVQRVLSGRRVFMQCQLRREELLPTRGGNPHVTHIGVVEDIVDAVMDQLMTEHCVELTNVCDSLGEHLMAKEFSRAA